VTTHHENADALELLEDHVFASFVLEDRDFSRFEGYRRGLLEGLRDGKGSNDEADANLARQLLERPWKEVDFLDRFMSRLLLARSRGDDTSAVDFYTRDGRAVRMVVGHDFDGEMGIETDAIVDDRPILVVTESNGKVSLRPLPDDLSGAKLVRARKEPVAAEIPLDDVILDIFKFGIDSWPDRWKLGAYHVRYRIGTVEETFTFTPDEIDRAVRTVIRTMLSPPPRVPIGPREVLDMLKEFTRTCMNYVEAYVRLKHRLPMPDLFHPEQKRWCRRLVKGLIKAAPTRRDRDQRWAWDLMVYAMVDSFLGKPVDHNRVTITDNGEATPFDDPGVRWNPNFSDAKIAEIKARSLGSRTFDSDRLAVH
jgi:hypothetical protein